VDGEDGLEAGDSTAGDDDAVSGHVCRAPFRAGRRSRIAA
jgi:hypothetical protein